METVTLEVINRNLKVIMKEIVEMKEEISELKGFEPEVRPEYLGKLREIKTEKGIPFRDMDELRKIIGK
jgi:hypothetical protein